MEYNKLVRDNIPQMIKAQGETPHIRILSQDEYLCCLRSKLNEEVAEYLESGSLEELADILEVVYALTEAEGYSTVDLLSAYEKKHSERGGFTGKIFLISKE